jgi:hypothetical protein
MASGAEPCFDSAMFIETAFDRDSPAAVLLRER